LDGIFNSSLKIKNCYLLKNIAKKRDVMLKKANESMFYS